MKLLVSPMDEKEAKAAVDGGADIIDVKNPEEGSLGANFPWVIKAIKEVLPRGPKLSATIGDLDYKPGFASLAAYGLSTLGVDYIKAGLFVSERQEAIELAKAIVLASRGRNCRVVLAGYADFKRTGSINPGKLPEVASIAGAHGLMIDTYYKNGMSLFDHMTQRELERFLKATKKRGLTTALAGSINTQHLSLIKKLAPDIVGVRGAVCTDNNRLSGKIEKEKVKEFKRQLGSK